MDIFVKAQGFTAAAPKTSASVAAVAEGTLTATELRRYGVQIAGIRISVKPIMIGAQRR